MKEYSNLAHNIIENIGGKENVKDLSHCVTRLRFHLYDESKANDRKIEDLSDVLTVMHSAGQYQIVIGNTVGDVYDAVMAQLDSKSKVKSQPANIEKKKISIKDLLIDLITAIFMPSIGVLCASGMIKGLNAILQNVGLYSVNSGMYTFINAMGDAIFYFFPIFLGYNTAKKFKISPFIGMLIGAILCYPAINGKPLNLLGLHMNVSYTSTVLPVILTTALAVPVYNFFKKIIPEAIGSFLTPMLVIMISVTVGYIIIGPIANTISQGISKVMLAIYHVSPIIAGLIFGALWQVMVVFGVHMAFIALAIVNMSQGISDPILSLQVFVAFAQAAVVFAIFLKTHDKKLKEISLPAFISAIFGVTEPAIYGITLPRIKMFLISCLGGALSGAYAAFAGLQYHMMAGLGVFEIPALFPKTGSINYVLIQSIIATLIAVIPSFVLALIFYKDDKRVDEDTDNTTFDNGKQKIEEIGLPVSGKVLPLSKCSDTAFASGVLGKGALIIPDKGAVYAPFDGTVETLFPTKHAIGLKSKSGIELLIHVGIDTVQLQGKYFEAKVKQGDTVKQGQVLLEFNINEIKKAGYILEIPIIITNSKKYNSITLNDHIQNHEESVGTSLLELG